jgi:hypothetical protein
MSSVGVKHRQTVKSLMLTSRIWKGRFDNASPRDFRRFDEKLGKDR